MEATALRGRLRDAAAGAHAQELARAVRERRVRRVAALLVPGSLRERLALLALLVTATFLGVLTLVFNLVIVRQLNAEADALLHTRAYAAAATVDISSAGTVSVRPLSDDPDLDVGTWIYAGRTALVRPPGSRDAQAQADALEGRGELTLSRESPERRYYAWPLQWEGRQVGTVVTTVDLDPYDRVQDLALGGSVVLAAVALAGGYLLARTIVGRALDPVGQMTRQAAQWGASSLPERFGTGARPTELDELAGTLDGLLETVAAALRHEQQLAAQLSHELRNPLATLSAELELLRSRPRTAEELEVGHAAMAASAERMGRVLESLLTAARATAAQRPGYCRVSDAVEAACDSLAPEEGRLVLRDLAPGATAGVEAALLERALAPVLDNALRHARTRVQVTIRPGPTGPQVVVDDDGPGVPGELGDRVFDPGVRAPGARPGGSGLGLALARRLARAGGGDIALEPSEAGARFVLQLPS